MRLIKYLNEEHDNIVKMIKANCKPWLSTIKPIIYKNKGFIRYVGRKNKVETIKRFTPRTDREPKDSSRELHDLFDSGFLERFGWKARSEGVFVWPSNNLDTFNKDSLWTFFYPIGEFKYIWSPRVKDLYNIQHLALEDPDKYLKTYTDKNLFKSFKSDLNFGNEVMFKCNFYYLVSIRYLNVLRENELI